MKYSVLGNLWLLAQMRQPGHSFYKDFDRSTFSRFPGHVLLDRDNFLKFLQRMEGQPLIAPVSDCAKRSHTVFGRLSGLRSKTLSTE